jgi:hypothetical protein
MVAIYYRREPLMSHQYTPSDEMLETHSNGNTSPVRVSGNLPIRNTCDDTCPTAGGLRTRGSGSGVTEAVESNRHGTSNVLAPYRHRAVYVAPSENAGRVTAEIEDGSPAATSDGVAATGPGHHARRYGIVLPPEARIGRDQRGGRKWRHDRRMLRERAAVPGTASEYRRPARTNPRVTPSAAGGVCGR